MGAWIETFYQLLDSHKGLLSHPVWVRGLKHNGDVEIQSPKQVAPRVGAWIETQYYYHDQ